MSYNIFRFSGVALTRKCGFCVPFPVQVRANRKFNAIFKRRCPTAVFFFFFLWYNFNAIKDCSGKKPVCILIFAAGFFYDIIQMFNGIYDMLFPVYVYQDPARKRVFYLYNTQAGRIRRTRFFYVYATICNIAYAYQYGYF